MAAQPRRTTLKPCTFGATLYSASKKIVPVRNISASRGNKSCVRVECFYKNDKKEPEHYKLSV